MRSIHPWNFITLARVVLEICSGQRTGRRSPAQMPATGDPIIRPVFDGRVITCCTTSLYDQVCTNFQNDCSKKSMRNFRTQNYLKSVHVFEKTGKSKGRQFLNKGEMTLVNYILHNFSVMTNVCINFQNNGSKTDGRILQQKITWILEFGTISMLKGRQLLKQGDLRLQNYFMQNLEKWLSSRKDNS